jgi:quinol monooxygenase YgiN
MSRAEPGSVDYHIHRSNDDPDTVMVYETWRSQAAFDAHLAQPYTKAFIGRLPDLLVGDLEISRFTMISQRPSQAPLAA